jgi:septum formation protein
MKKIILASASPRRKELLEKIGLKFEIVSSDYEEDMSLKMKPLALAKFLSRGKAESVAKKYKNHVIIAADTFVALGDELLGKPHLASEAEKMLRKISGKVVSIITGYTIIDTAEKKQISNVSEAKVHMKKLTAEEIKNYVKTEEPLDKAGAFAVQGIGSVLIKKIEGDFFGIVGLPLYDLAQSLKKMGIKII